MTEKIKVLLLGDCTDISLLNTMARTLRRKGYETTVTEVQWNPNNVRQIAIPEEARTTDIVLFYGSGYRNWAVDTLVELNKPTVYISYSGYPNLDQVTNHKTVWSLYPQDMLNALHELAIA